MKQFKTILEFELLYYFKNKVFVGVTIFLVALITLVMFFPRIKAGLGGDDGESGAELAGELPVMLVAGEFPESGSLIEEAFGNAFGDYDVQVTSEDTETIRDMIMSGEAECAFVLSGLTSYTYYVGNLSMYDSNPLIADEALQGIYRINAMVEGGIPAKEAQAILAKPIEHEVASLGKDQAQNFFYTYIMIFALYMVILLYGQMVATNVATEKSSRVMEVLITSAKPASMMFGKVIASCIAGLIQLIAVFGVSFLCYNLNKGFWEENEIIASIFDIPLTLLVYMLIFFVLGFFVYAFLYGAIGSTASKLEDINTSVMPLTILFVIAFMVVMFSMTNGSVDNIAMRVCSYVPFTSPMAMFTRIAMSTVPFYEIVLSIVILVASVIGIGVLSAKIYRVGVLLYGTTPKIGSIVKAIRRA